MKSGLKKQVCSRFGFTLGLLRRMSPALSKRPVYDLGASWRPVVNFAQSRQLSLKIAIDNTGVVAKAWDDAKLTPTTYLMNKRGKIVKQYVGEPDFAALHALFKNLLPES